MKRHHWIGLIVLALAVVVSACGTSGSAVGAGAKVDDRATTTSVAAGEARESEATTPPDGGDELVAVLDELISGTDLPALGATVFNHQGIIETTVVGVRRRGDPTPVGLTDQFHIGSNAKAMTATLVALYVDGGEISWETTVGDVFGGVLPSLHAGFSGVTIRQLLSHTAGIDDELAYPSLLHLAASDLSVIEQRSEVAATILTRPPHHPAGEFMYSNVGYVIAGAMLEELTDRSWEDLVQTRIFDRLAMSSCGFYAPGTPGEVDQPWGHLTDRDNQPMDPGDPDAEYPRVLAPAGLVHCSMADWALFLQSQLRGFEGSDTEIISPEAFAALGTPPQGSDYALGWFKVQTPNGTLFMHTGSNDRFMSEAVLVPKADWGVLVVTNLGEAAAAPTIDAVAGAMLARHLAPGAAK